ncbi:MAG: M56 family metallopeptidase [Candidatus Gastranaerophilales bacterium]|nr:M56 family metallopeptidase [Candidatus Gastranaerophilales bacterium]
MNLLFSMTLSGSVMTLLCLILKALMRKVPERVYYALWKVCILYFLIPLPFLKKFYGLILQRLAEMTRAVEGKEIVQFLSRRGAAVIKLNGVTQYNFVLRSQVLTAVIWISVAVLISLYFLIDYFKKKKDLERSLLVEQSQDQDTIEKWKNESHIRRRLRVSPCSLQNVCFTLGFFRPFIVYSECSSMEKELLLRHELMHVKRWDVFWQSLMVIVLALFWFNPFVWVLRNQIRKSCECSCDEAVLEGRSRKERERYMEMIVRRAMVQNKKIGVLSFAEKAGKRTGKRRKSEIEERINNIMNMNKKKPVGKFAAAMLVASVAVLNSITVFAYEDVQFVSISRLAPSETSTVWQETKSDDAWIEADFFFVPDGVTDLMEKVVMEQERIYYDIQFVDENDNIYPVEETSLHVNCDHVYESGLVQKHELNTSGGCILFAYEGKRCSECGDVETGERSNRSFYDVCPH